MSTQAASAAAKLFTAQDADLLKQHLQALVAVEFLTIPLYLTAVYSFTEAALAYRVDGKAPLYDAQQEVLSVAVQEMLHLQLAANLCNAFGVTPQIPKLVANPGETITVPHLEPTPGTPFTTTIGNLPNVMQALIAIETPDAGDTGGFPGPNDQVIYKSIADLYHATLHLLHKYVAAYAMVTTADDPAFIPDHLQVNYATFQTTYAQIPTIKQRSDAAVVANAVTDQGEGGLVAKNVAGGMFKSGDDGVLPQFQPAAGTRFARWGAKTHYQRFLDVKNVIDSKEFVNQAGVWFYAADGTASPDLPSWAPSAAALQGYAGTIWSYLVDAMQSGFADGTLNPSTQPAGVGPGFNDAMLAFKYITPLLWQHGQVIGYVYAAGATGATAQKAMDGADPLSLFHWDAKTAQLRQTWKTDGVMLNACQGLNNCAGLGWGGLGTSAGDGACATADLHTCGGGNDCAAQGGCAFLSTGAGNALLDPDQQWVPSENSCAGTGGCQTPISTRQVFDRGAEPSIDAQTGAAWTPPAKSALQGLIGTGVWDRARSLLAAKFPSAPLPTPQSTADYDSSQRRAALAPTSV